MRVIREYKRAESLEEAWQLNQKKSNRVLGGLAENGKDADRYGDRSLRSRT